MPRLSTRPSRRWPPSPRLLDALVTKAAAKDREVEAAKAKARSEARFAA